MGLVCIKLITAPPCVVGCRSVLTPLTTHHARPRRRLGIKPSCPLEVVNLIQTAVDQWGHSFGDWVAVARRPAPPSNLTNGASSGCPRHSPRSELGKRGMSCTRHFTIQDSGLPWSKIRLPLVEPHLIYEGWEITPNTCKNCRPIKSRIVPSPSNRGTKPLAACPAS
jgi:hypothetical protein